MLIHLCVYRLFLHFDLSVQMNIRIYYITLQSKLCPALFGSIVQC